MPARFRVEKEGYSTFEGAPFGVRLTVRLFREDEIPNGMVYVPGGTAEFGAADPVPLEGFWIDKYEVTNREYKAFVDAGGYRDDRLWPEGSDRSAFVDTTGRPGPAGWALGSYPEGQDDLPVGGVSWFEARAYAAWAGKSLPTVFHWRLAARQSIFSEILLWSNFDAGGPVSVGTSGGIGPNGTYDMAGNVREWCFNSAPAGRCLRGGAWNDATYMFGNITQADPFDRSVKNGFRCVVYGDEADLPEGLFDPYAPESTRDLREEDPVSDDVFEAYVSQYAYDPLPLEASIDARHDDNEDWVREGE